MAGSDPDSHATPSPTKTAPFNEDFEISSFAPLTFRGIVTRGRQLGRKIGFPTANMLLSDDEAPAYGVYAAMTTLPDGRRMPGVASVGVSPTIDGVTPLRLEVWLFDFDEDIYDQVIEMDLLSYLREELKFEGLEPLITQIKADAAEARRRLAELNLA